MIRSFFFARPAKIKKVSARIHSPDPFLRAESKSKTFQKELAEILRNPFPRKLLSQNLVHYVFSVSPHFC